MNFINFLAVIVIFHIIIKSIDLLLRKSPTSSYIRFTRRRGFDIKWFRVQWHTNAFDYVGRWSRKYEKILRTSYTIGVVSTALLFPVALYMILSSIFEAGGGEVDPSQMIPQKISEDSAASPGRMEILLPGVNLPLSDVGFYVISLLICSVIHELGHGMAAFVSDVPVTGFGILLALIIPIAYTEIDTATMDRAKFKNKMKILSAGIWHNLVLAGAAYAILLSLPWLLSPIYLINDGVFVTKVVRGSVIQGDAGKNGIFTGDRITEINGCNVRTSSDYEICMRSMMLIHPAYCVPQIFTNQYGIKNAEVPCCSEDDASFHCFEFVNRREHRSCMQIRRIIEHSESYCHYAELSCLIGANCIRPIINGSSSTIIHIRRSNRQNDFIYFGPTMDVLRNVEVSDFIPKTKMVGPSVGEWIALLLKYITVFSSGLAIVNTFPCFGLDGHLILSAAISHIDKKILSQDKKELTIMIVNLLGSFTFTIAILKIILNMIL